MLAIIAGAGLLPVKAAALLTKQKKSFFVLSLFPEDNKSLIQEATNYTCSIITLPFFKVGKILNELKTNNTREVLLIGKVDKRKILSKVRFDFIGAKLLASLATRSDVTIMEKILATLAEHNISVISQDAILEPLFCQPGILCGTNTEYIETNIKLGLAYAEKLSSFDIGQTIVMKDTMILAVEAIEGTNECIKRGIALGKSNIVLCKSAHIYQNRKYDLPTLGPDSLANISIGEVTALAWLAKSTFIVDREEFIIQANSLGITLVAV